MIEWLWSGILEYGMGMLLVLSLFLIMFLKCVGRGRLGIVDQSSSGELRCNARLLTVVFNRWCNISILLDCP